MSPRQTVLQYFFVYTILRQTVPCTICHPQVLFKTCFRVLRAYAATVMKSRLLRDEESIFQFELHHDGVVIRILKPRVHVLYMCRLHIVGNDEAVQDDDQAVL